MSASTTKSPAKPTAPKAKAPAKPTAPKPVAPAKPTAPKAVAPATVGLVASVALSNEMTNGTKKAHTFRLKTMEIAIALGYKPSTVAPFDNIVLFEKGDVKFTVTYSAQDYVRKVEGPITILPGDAKKWISLNAALAEHA